MMRMASSAMASCACSVEAPMWCVPQRLGRSRMGSLKSAGGLGWFGVEHVQAGAELAALERSPQRRLVHHLAAGGVDENGVGLQAGRDGRH